MAYIGKQPAKGNFVKLDTITTSATTTFNLTNGGVAYSPISANNCLVSLNGILQAPTDSYTISGSTIIFSSALTTSDVIDFIIVLGDVLSLGTVSDSTIGIAKFTATGTPSSSTFLRGDNSWASAGATAGQVIQVVSTSLASASITTTSTSFVDVTGFTASITPASASNKILILVNIPAYVSNSGSGGYITILRGATNLGHSTGGFGLLRGGADTFGIMSANYLDSPATTSSTTYKLQFLVNAGSMELTFNGARGTLTLLEIKG